MIMKDKVKALWKLCFTDSDEFIDLYFEKRYTDEINMAIEEESQVISSLQLIPYPMTFYKKIIPTSYISGACTHPHFQGKGIMRELLSRSFSVMYQNGVLISTLIPAEEWLFAYYEKNGYAPVFHKSEVSIVQDSLWVQPAINIHKTDRVHPDK